MLHASIVAASWIGLPLGATLVLATWRSIITTIILPRMVLSRITRFSWKVVYRAFLKAANKLPRYEQKDSLLAMLGPVSLLVALIVWLAMLLIGFALMFWPLLGSDFGEAVRLSGSSLFTLGVVSSGRGGPTAVEFLAAASGMVVVALQIGYLPTLYSAYNRRETLVTALNARAGEPAWGPEILARHALIGSLDALPALFESWETLAADITESHVSYPWLMAFRSPDLMNSWVISLLAVLDAAALYLALSPSTAPPETRVCLRAGYVCFRKLASVGEFNIDPDPRPDSPIALPYEFYLRGVEVLERAHFPMERTAEEAWAHFRGWRVNYEQAAYDLAQFTVAVPAPWSGRRKHMTRQEVFDVLSQRPVHRTPDDPEGLESFAFRPTMKAMKDGRKPERESTGVKSQS